MKQYLPANESPRQHTMRYTIGSIICLLWLLFSFWAGWGWLLLLPLIIDYYFTKYINWSWGRNHSNPLVRGIIILLGDIIYVVALVTFIFTYFFQNFAIPSSSLEKTLLTGDYLFVSKLKYGPRTPMTPLALPMVHNVAFGGKSYSDSPLLPYRRLKGYGLVERNDLVVFNFPAGDTVAMNMPNPDYLTLCQVYGREMVHGDKGRFGEIVYRPVDRRDHYVKRCIGLPGETLEIRNTQVYIDGKAIENPEHMQLNYIVQTDGAELSKELLDALEINYRDVIEQPLSGAITAQEASLLSQNYGIVPLDSITNNIGRLYEIPLTKAMVQALRSEPYIKGVSAISHSSDNDLTYPLTLGKGWSVDNYGPLLIPKKGMTIPLTRDNYITYERCIRAYEGHQLDMREDGMIIVDGKPATTYTFAMDYYFMMGDNRHNSADSRAWGFVPEDHIVGQPSFLWLSLNDEQPLFGGGIRWKRMFQIITAK